MVLPSPSDRFRAILGPTLPARPAAPVVTGQPARIIIPILIRPVSAWASAPRPPDTNGGGAPLRPHNLQTKKKNSPGGGVGRQAPRQLRPTANGIDPSAGSFQEHPRPHAPRTAAWPRGHRTPRLVNGPHPDTTRFRVGVPCTSHGHMRRARSAPASQYSYRKKKIPCGAGRPINRLSNFHPAPSPTSRQRRPITARVPPAFTCPTHSPPAPRFGRGSSRRFDPAQD